MNANQRRQPLLRDDREAFFELVGEVVADTELSTHMVERDYWMSKITHSLMFPSRKYPGSFASIGGGSMLSLVGITERLSEDVDINVTFVDGVENCSSNKSKRLLVEYQTAVETVLKIGSERFGGGGGNYFRTVHYPYPSVLPESETEEHFVKLEMALRDVPKEGLMELPGMSYLARAGAGIGSGSFQDLEPCPILGVHPLEIMCDKLDATHWREAKVPELGEKALDMLAKRIRDHYDLHCIIKWLRSNDLFNSHDCLATVERLKQRDRQMSEKMRLHRTVIDRPPEGYHTLNAWTRGTREHDRLTSEYPRLRTTVFGELPTWDEVCDTIRSAEGVI